MDKTANLPQERTVVRLQSGNLWPAFPAYGKRYGCVFIFQEGNDDASQQVLKYEVDIRFVKELPEKRKRLFRVERISETYINDYLPDMLIDQLACEVGKVFYPLLIETDYTGTFSGIYNYKEIQERWPAIREKADRYFKGRKVEKYLNLMENVLGSKEDLDKMFANDLFFHTYFTSLYQNYTLSFSLQSERLYPVMGKINPLKFSVEHQLCNELTDYGAIKIVHSGTMIDERTVRDLEQGENYPIHKMLYPYLGPAKGTYKAYYTLNYRTKQIRTIDARWVLELNKQKTVEVKIHQLDLDPESKDSIIIEEGVRKKKSGFFSTLFGD